MRKTLPINFSWYVKQYEDKDLTHIDIDKFKKVNIPNQPIDLFPSYF